ncbi:MAG TPA: hypothetical protein VL283_00215 [Candidatus Baltobacteraceae bacterium]|nr:hypothetical protein [Candidatus Baltobacteraceae bacterium]
MKKLLMAAAALLLIGAGCGAQTSGNVDVNVGNQPSGTVNVGGSGSAGGSGAGGYQY